MSFETLPPFYKVFGDLFVSNAHLPKQLPEFGFEVIETFNSGKWNEKEEDDLNNAVLMFGMQDVAVLQAAVKTRSKVQVRNRIQKMKVKQELQDHAEKC